MLRVIALCGLLCGLAAADEVTRVVKVHDGDTFLTEDGDNVRLLGIDAAESYEAGGDVAGEMLEMYVLGRTVRLEADRSNTDHFGRLLRWVWVGDTNVNLLLVDRGYAPVRLYQEGLKYEDTLKVVEEQAARSGRGLWAFNVYTPPSLELIRERLRRDNPDDSGVISWVDAADYIGKAAVVEGDIIRTYQSERVLFLNFHEDYRNTFVCAIFVNDLPRFPTDAKDYYLGKRVRVTGIIKEYRGAPEIIISDPGQVEVLGPAAGAEN
ncbi:MAG: thermonuclease family protein [bacterium]